MLDRGLPVDWALDGHPGNYLSQVLGHRQATAYGRFCFLGAPPASFGEAYRPTAGLGSGSDTRFSDYTRSACCSLSIPCVGPTTLREARPATAASAKKNPIRSQGRFLKTGSGSLQPNYNVTLMRNHCFKALSFTDYP